MTAAKSKFRIPMSAPDLTDMEREAVAAVMRTPNLSMGAEIQAFEAAFREHTGCDHAIGVSSGTAGLHLCVRAAEIGDWDGGESDLVITTPFSFVASANVLLFERAIPIFVDIDPLSGNIDPQLVRQAVEEITAGRELASRWLPRRGVPHRDGKHGHALKAILPVDVFGQPADMDPIIEIARTFSLKVIEDSCEALGAEYKGRIAGTLGDMGVFAFYPNKQITTGEGAIIVTNDDKAAYSMLAMRNQGRAPGDTWLQHTYLGYNYRLDEMSAALGRVQIGRLDELMTKRKQVAAWYRERIDEIPGVEAPTVLASTTRMSWFVYVVRFDEAIDRDRIAARLKDKGIPNRPYFLPIHLQPYMAERFGYREGDFPITEDLGRRSLALPFSGMMEEGMVVEVCESLREAIAEETTSD